MRHRICSVFVTGALALGSLFAIAPMAVAAEASVSHCVAPADLIQLDQPLRRTARRLASHKLIIIVALGSSSTAGAGASSAETTYPSQLMVELTQRFQTQPITVLNRGISGERAVDMLARFDKSVSAERPDLVLWQVGTLQIYAPFTLFDPPQELRSQDLLWTRWRAVLGFKRQPLPGARYVDQDGADSQVWGVLGHLPTLGGVLSALDRRNHSHAPDQNPRYPDTDKMFRPLDIEGCQPLWRS